MKIIFYPIKIRLHYFLPAILACALYSSTLSAQSTIKGKITDEKGKPVAYVSIYLKNTLSGATTDTAGKYVIKTKEQGNQVLAIRFTGYDSINYNITIESGQEYVLNFTLKSGARKLDEVVITAGSFEANNDRKVAVLRPLDIYTTAGAGGDIVGAIETLPGTQHEVDQTGLFVRGGDASEAATIVDGSVIQNAFFSNVPGVAQRSRFAPYQFNGISFSSGGYSARYGQAMSGVLDLTTNDLPENTTFTAGINQAGASVSGSKLWKFQSLEGTFTYTNLQPFYGVTKSNIDFYQPPVGLGGSARWVWTNRNNDVLKISTQYNQYSSGTNVVDPFQPDSTLAFNLTNYYGIVNGFYRHFFNTKTYLTLSSSFSDNEDKVTWGGEPYNKTDWRAQGRAELWSQISKNIFGVVGTEVQRYSVSQQDTLQYHYDETIVAAYAEAEWKPAPWFGLKPGVRAEHSELLNRNDVAPRLSAAFRINKYGQIDFAGGVFYQDAADMYLLVGDRPNFQQAVHYIANYQFTNENRTFRIEGYYKSYSDLVREEVNYYNPNPYRLVTGPVNNSGYGFAEGLDVFWRDKSSVKNLDYWISYSYIDTRRLYENFPSPATPNFVANNNLNVVAKYSIGKTGFFVSSTFTLASGKPYYNPSNPIFLGDRSPDYADLAASLDYIFSTKKLFSVIYLSFDDITNRKNILGYNYTYPELQRIPIVPALYRSVFVGMLVSLTPFKKEEL